MFFPNVFGAKKNRGPKRSNLHTFVSSLWSLSGGQEIPGRECEASRCIKQGDKNTDEGNGIFLVVVVVVVVVVVGDVVVVVVVVVAVVVVGVVAVVVVVVAVVAVVAAAGWWLGGGVDRGYFFVFLTPIVVNPQS